MPTLPPDNDHRRAKPSLALQSLVMPKNRDRRSKDIPQVDALGIRHGNVVRTVPLLPPDHPHAKLAETENVDPNAVNAQDTPRRSRRDKEETTGSNVRSKSTVSLRSLVGATRSKSKTRESSPEKKEKSPKKPKKTKSSTGLAGLFSKNKSSKDVSEQKSASDAVKAQPDNDEPSTTPIWAQFATRQVDPLTEKPQREVRVRDDVSDDNLRHIVREMDLYTSKEYDPYAPRDSGDRPTLSRPGSSYRPQSFCAIRPDTAAHRSQLGSRGSDVSGTSHDMASQRRPQSTHGDVHRQISGSSTEQSTAQSFNLPKRGSRVAAAVAAINGQASSPSKADTTTLDPKAVEQAFEAVLERRNIPEDQRRSMRSLTLHIKADFIKQDGKASRPSSPVKQPSETTVVPTRTEDGNNITTSPSKADLSKDRSPSKRERPRSRTFNFTKSDSSPSKRTKSSSRPTSVVEPKPVGRSASQVSLADKTATGRSALPSDYVAHLHAMVDPTQAEVGRVHKLRILLRNETVDWVGSFVELGGMSEIIALLHRIMAIEWREDHEDQLLHEALLCLKGISTTKVALQKLAEVADTLFPKLLHMIFDEDKKGPSEYNTRGIIVNVLFAHLSADSTSPSAVLTARAKQILSFLEERDKTEAQPLPFVREMHSRRPYRTWQRELSNVTKEVFWIFLHHANVVALPDSASTTDDPSTSTALHRPTGFPEGPAPAASATSQQPSFTRRHFPTTRAPVPAAPYIGGVEWDATTYLTSHLDLLNGLLASLADKEARNALRADLAASGFERVMGQALRTCKEKFYAGVHDALRTWVAAAVEDGWGGVQGVRTGDFGGAGGGGGEDAGVGVPGSPGKRKARANSKEDKAAPELKLGTAIGKGTPIMSDEDVDGWLA